MPKIKNHLKNNQQKYKIFLLIKFYYNNIILYIKLVFWRYHFLNNIVQSFIYSILTSWTLPDESPLLLNIKNPNIKSPILYRVIKTEKTKERHQLSYKYLYIILTCLSSLN